MPVVVLGVSKRGERTERVIDAVLWAHDAEITKQVLFAFFSAGSRRPQTGSCPARFGPRTLAAVCGRGRGRPAGSLPFVAMAAFGKPVGETLGGDHAAYKMPAGPNRRGRRDQGVLVVEDQPGASQLERQRDSERQGWGGCRRGRRRNGPACRANLHERHSAIRVYAHVSSRPAGSRGQRVTWVLSSSISARASRSLVPSGQIAATSYPASRSAWRSCQTRRSKEDRQVFDDYEGPTRRHRGTRNGVRVRSVGRPPPSR